MAGSFVIIALLSSLVLTAWNGFKAGYEIEEENLQDGKNIMEKIDEINLLEGINVFISGIFRLGRISNPLDLVGALVITASGTLQIIGGLAVFPLEIFGAMTGFYDNIVPPVVTRIIGFLGVLAVGFVLLSAKLGKDV